MEACIYDSFSPCEDCGRCKNNKIIYRETIDDKHDEVYHEVSYDCGYTREEE